MINLREEVRRERRGRSSEGGGKEAKREWRDSYH